MRIKNYLKREGLLDITAPHHGADVIVNYDAKTIHVNVDGKCVLRICHIPFIDHSIIGAPSETAKEI